MTVTTLTSGLQVQELDSYSTTESEAFLGTGSMTTGPSVDSRIGDTLLTTVYHAYTAYFRINLWQTGIDEADVFSAVTHVLNVDIAPVTTDFTSEIYEWNWTQPTLTTGDWPTPTELTTMYDAGQLCSSVAATSIAIGDVTYTGTAYLKNLIKTKMRADEQYVYFVITTDRHRQASAITSSVRTFDIEDNVGVDSPDMKITHAAYDNSGDETTGIIEATDNGTSHCRLRSASTVYLTARAGGTFTASNGLIIGGQSLSGANYYCYQGFDEYDISSIPATSVITDVVLNPYWQTVADVGQWHEWYVYDHGGYPITSADWQDGTEMDALLSSGKRMFNVDAFDTLAANTRAEPHNVRAIQLIQEAVNNGDTYLRMVMLSNDLRLATVATASAEYGYYDDGVSANPSNLTIYYRTPDPQVDTGILGAIF